MKNCVVYTAITEGYDNLKEPQVQQDEDIDFVCFTDDGRLQSEKWDIKMMDVPVVESTRKARYLKTHPHLCFPNYRYSIWVDGSLSIVGNMKHLLEEVINQSTLGVYAHAKRGCLYSAALNCIEKQKDNKNIIEKQMNQYRQANYPANNGLVASGALVRDHHNSDVVDLMTQWWDQIYQFSKRDQLSFNYICWQLGFEYYAIPERIGDGRYFRRNPHTQVSNNALLFNNEEC